MLNEVPEGWVASKPLACFVDNIGKKWDGKSKALYVGLEHIAQSEGRLVAIGDTDGIASAKSAFEKCDVLFGKLRPNLRKFWYADTSGVCSTDILVLRAKQGLLPKFLFFLTQSTEFIECAVQDAVGTKMPRTSWKSLGAQCLPIPPLTEQKRIAEVLRSVDESIQATQRLIEQAERVKNAFASSIVSGQNPYFQPVQHGPITELCDINPRQKMKKGNVYTFVNMASLPINSSLEIRYTTKELGSGGAKFQNGDTLFARITPCTENGKLGYVSDLNEDELAFGSTEFTILRPRFSATKMAYIYCYAGGLRKHLITRMVGSTGRQRVPNEAFTEYEIAFYDEESQLGIIALFDKLEIAQQNNKELLRRLEQTKKGLMDDLLTGKVRTV